MRGAPPKGTHSPTPRHEHVLNTKDWHTRAGVRLHTPSNEPHAAANAETSRFSLPFRKNVRFPSGNTGEPITISGAGGIGAIYSSGSNNDLSGTIALAANATINRDIGGSW